jgi:hypothetical protein
MGRIPNAYSFENILEIPNLMTAFGPAGENLAGWVCHKSAVLVATSPIWPSEEVRNLLTHFDVGIDPRTGAAVAFRSMGNATLDQSNFIAECSYGAAVGVADALGRINGA